MIEINSKELLRRTQQKIFQETPFEKSDAKRNMAEGYFVSALKLLFDEPILRHIQHCTVVEARPVMVNENQSVSTFIRI